ncbi:MAG: WecB/TagA/CpsF family glycosyltransferase [Kofleriaceae bacterium]
MGSARSLPPPVEVLGIPIHPVSAEQLVEQLVDWGQAGPLRRVLNVNVHAMNLAADHADFADALRTADVVFCDGFGVKWGARLVGVSLPHRLTPPDWIDAFAHATAAAGQSVYALGDEVGVARAFQATLRAAHGGYLDVGAGDGFFAKTGPANDAVIDAINASGATHLLVGLGMPLQERWIVANASRLRVRTAISVGALFRWHAGIERRAPSWMTEHGLEWLDRLGRHPVRHFRRYVVGNPRFVARLLADRIARPRR